MKKNKIILVSLILVLCSMITLDVAFKHYTEQNARQTARYVLENTKHCVNQLVHGKDKVSNDELEQALKTCSGLARTTPTGDAFAFDTVTADFVFDPSLDCYVEGGKKMTVESECSIHKNKELCEAALRVLTRGYDSDQDTGAFWQFNSGIEYLEFVVLPEELFGYDGVQKGGRTRPHQVVLVQGVIEDELFAKYSVYRKIFFAFCGLVMLVLIVSGYTIGVADNGRYKNFG